MNALDLHYTRFDPPRFALPDREPEAWPVPVPDIDDVMDECRRLLCQCHDLAIKDSLAEIRQMVGDIRALAYSDGLRDGREEFRAAALRSLG